MGMFGKGMFGNLQKSMGYGNQSGMTPDEIADQQSKREMFRARMMDVGKIWSNQSPDSVDRLTAAREQQQQQERQRQAMQAVLAKMNPVQTGGAMGPGMDGAPMGQGYTAPKRSIQDLLPDLMAAQAEGADIGPMVQMLKLGQPQEDQVYNMGDGYLGVVKPGQDPRFVAAPSVEERDSLRQAQINAANALAGVRQNQGAYYGAKARQPYAPPRSASGRGGSSAMDAIAAELRRRGHQVD